MLCIIFIKEAGSKTLTLFLLRLGPENTFLYQNYSSIPYLDEADPTNVSSFCSWCSASQAAGNSRYFYMKLLRKKSSRRANSDNQKAIEDLSNVIADIDSITAINNYFNNDVTGMANHIVIFFSWSTICYMNNKSYYWTRKTRKYLWLWVLFLSNSYTSLEYTADELFECVWPLFRACA